MRPVVGIKCVNENCSQCKQIPHTAQKMKFSIIGFFSKCEQIRSFLRICSHLLKKSLMENFIFCAVTFTKQTLNGNPNFAAHNNMCNHLSTTSYPVLMQY